MESETPPIPPVILKSFERDGELLMLKYSPIWEQWAVGVTVGCVTFFALRHRRYSRWIISPPAGIVSYVAANAFIAKSRMRRAVLNETFEQGKEGSTENLGSKISQSEF